MNRDVAGGENKDSLLTQRPSEAEDNSAGDFSNRPTRRAFVRNCGFGVAAATAWVRSLGAQKNVLAPRSSAQDPFHKVPEHGAVSTKWTEDWEDGMVSGNGRMGVVVYGKPETPILILNQNRLYTAHHKPTGIGPANTARFVPEIRRLIREQGYGPALDFSYQKAKENGLAPDESNDFHPGVVLNFQLEGADQASEYRRSENFSTGEVETTWHGAAGRFRMRSFVSRADNVVVVSIEKAVHERFSCGLAIAIPNGKPVRFEPRHGENWIGTHNLYPPGNGGYDGVVRIVPAAGSLQLEDGTAQIAGASKITILARIERYRPPQESNIEGLASAVSSLPADYELLLSRHVKIHGEIFDRVRLDLHGGADRALTADQLLDRAAADKSLAPALLEKIYDACRYVILSSSGDLPPNLQGIWSGSWSPPWHSDYSADANLQLAVDSTCSANMPEILEGLFRLIEAGVPSWREGAQKLAGCRGILYPARMQDQGTYFQQNRSWPWFNQIPIAGWLGHYFYDYYVYTGDRTFLANRAIPYLKDCALFYEDWYVTDPDGHLRATPSFSYECANSDNATIEFAVVKEVLTNLIAGCELLHIESDGVARWKTLLAKIPPYMVNTSETTGGPVPHYLGMDGNGTPAVPDGTLKEFIEANMVDYPSHRHLSSLYPLFVSYELNPDKTPELWRAATLWYERKIASVHETESHYRMQASLSAARLGRGDDAWRFLTDMATNRVFHSSLVPSHYDQLKVFNVDASGGIPAVINNCLIFSQPGHIDLLPALPEALPQGSIRGILARGQIAVNELAWDRPAGTIAMDFVSGTAQKVIVGLPPQAVTGTLILNGQSHRVNKGSSGKLACELTLPKGKSAVTITFHQA
jgi:alpha-L-fucosidase 2